MRNFSAIPCPWQEQVTFWWDKDFVRFVFDQHAKLVLAHWNNSRGRHVAPLCLIILIPSQPVCGWSPHSTVHGEAHILLYMGKPTLYCTWGSPHSTVHGGAHILLYMGEPTFYCTWGENENHHTTNVMKREKN